MEGEVEKLQELQEATEKLNKSYMDLNSCKVPLEDAAKSSWECLGSLRSDQAICGW